MDTGYKDYGFSVPEPGSGEYGRDLAFHGGVSVQHLLPHCTADEVRAEVRRLIREVSAGGGFIIAPTHSLGRDIPPGNLIALVEEFTRQG